MVIVQIKDHSRIELLWSCQLISHILDFSEKYDILINKQIRQVSEYAEKIQYNRVV